MNTRNFLALGLLGVACLGGSQAGPGQGGFGGGGFHGNGSFGNPLGNDPSMDRTIVFRGTISLRDLPAWLTKQNIDFVIADPDKLPDRKIVMNVNGKPLRDVLMSIGNATGGFWTASGQVYALRFLEVHGAEPMRLPPMRPAGPPPGGPGPLPPR